MIKRARQNGLVEIGLVDIRDFAEGNTKKVDDRPYGGGPGMVLMAEPIKRSIRSVKTKESRVIYLSPQGAVLNARKCQRLAERNHLVLLCGHYEGVDQRVIDLEVDEEISIGDFVMTSGAPAAVVLVDAVSRFIPEVIGNALATGQDSFQNGIFDSPVYTRPPLFEGMEVPHVLMQGDHSKIAEWRRSLALEKTQRVRPDLVKKLNAEEGES